MIVNKTLTTILALLFFGWVQAQEELPAPREGTNSLKQIALKKLEKCVEAYAQTKTFSMDVEYTVFYDLKTNFQKPDEQAFGTVIRDGENFYQEEMGNLKVITNEYQLFINTKTMRMSISNRTMKDLNPINQPIASDSGKMAEAISKVDKIENGYRFHYEKGPIKYADIILDQNGLMQCWRSYYRKKMKFGEKEEVEVVTQLRYNNFDTNPELNTDPFDIAKYVLINSSGEVTPKGKYKNYEVFNHINSSSGF